ncbi:MAG: DUF2203 domain-containing protein [Gemmataceae bacterium]|nr:DUF2203 domain-containing protein [Gemmataceae bacterium]MDW8264839.1 DUF2203 family protein [Gemmataceae bacterium]
MSGSIENTAPSAPETSNRRDIVMSLSLASRMLPLVRRIVDDVTRLRQTVRPLRAERDRLDRQRQMLAWPLRRRRYQLHEELAELEHQLHACQAELDYLGVVLFDADSGQVGFPTIVNDRRAYFSWRLGEEGLSYWHFAGESIRRPIPSAWVKMSEPRLVKNR